MELEVLQGAKSHISKYRPIIYLENDRKNNRKKIIDYISNELGYKAFYHIPPLFNKSNHFNNKTNIYKELRSINMVCLDMKKHKKFYDTLKNKKHKVLK